MNNQRGLSLVEILGSIVIIGIILTMLGAIVIQAAQHTRSNELTDRAITLARNITEEIKFEIRNIKVQHGSLSTSPVSLQIPDSINEVQLIDVSLGSLWTNDNHIESISYPNSTNPQFTINIRFTHVPPDSPIIIEHPRPTSGEAPLVSVDTYNNFRKAIVTTTNVTTGKSYTLESLIDF